jgi:predicted alpha/beta superfamily hydrolase
LPESRAKDQGRISIHRRFPSNVLSTPRDIAVYLPPYYGESPDARYPVLYMQDGQNLFDPATAFMGNDWRADMTADALIREGRVPPLLIVGVYNTGVRRISEYTPTRDPARKKGGKGGRYARMLARELKPFIDSHYRTKRGACDTGVGGSSLGGLVSLEAALRYPRVFGAAAVMSPSVWWDRRSIIGMVDAYKEASCPRIWLDTGTQESTHADQVVGDARALREALVEKGWREGADLAYMEDQGAGHNEAAWGGRLPGVLQWMFGTK